MCFVSLVLVINCNSGWLTLRSGAPSHNWSLEEGSHGGHGGFGDVLLFRLVLVIGCR
jgi:hypothetical protein